MLLISVIGLCSRDLFVHAKNSRTLFPNSVFSFLAILNIIDRIELNLNGYNIYEVYNFRNVDFFYSIRLRVMIRNIVVIIEFVE